MIRALGIIGGGIVFAVATFATLLGLAILGFALEGGL